MGKILRIAFRHLEAIKDQVIVTLSDTMAVNPSLVLKDWFKRHEPDLLPYCPEGFGEGEAGHKGPLKSYTADLFLIIREYENANRADVSMKRYVEERDKR